MTAKTPPPFDPAAPLPDLRIPVTQSWEPAAKHYRDIEPETMEETT